MKRNLNFQNWPLSANGVREKVGNWFLDMRIFSYLERRKARRLQFYYDTVRLLVSLRYRPRHWEVIIIRGHPFQLTNTAEKMELWVANSRWGVDFRIADRRYGGVFTAPNWLLSLNWRGKLFDAGMRAVANPWVHKRNLD